MPSAYAHEYNNHQTNNSSVHLSKWAQQSLLTPDFALPQWSLENNSPSVSHKYSQHHKRDILALVSCRRTSLHDDVQSLRFEPDYQLLIAFYRLRYFLSLGWHPHYLEIATVNLKTNARFIISSEQGKQIYFMCLNMAVNTWRKKNREIKKTCQQVTWVHLYLPESIRGPNYDQIRNSNYLNFITHCILQCRLRRRKSWTNEQRSPFECANVSNVQNAVPEHRASFRNYLMSVRHFSFSTLSSAELEFKAANKNTTDVLKVYQSKCRDLGEQLYSIGY